MLWGLLIGACALFALAAAGIGFLSRVAPALFETAHVIDDWPDGDHSDKDRWRGGQIYGMKADRIRRVAKPSGNGVDADTISYFMRVPMSDDDFSAFVARLKSNPAYEFRHPTAQELQSANLQPEWFPQPARANYVGDAKDESSWRVRIFRGSPDSHTYFFLG